MYWHSDDYTLICTASIHVSYLHICAVYYNALVQWYIHYDNHTMINILYLQIYTVLRWIYLYTILSTNEEEPRSDKYALYVYCLGFPLCYFHKLLPFITLYSSTNCIWIPDSVKINVIETELVSSFESSSE